jgi:hypothetical protein
MRPLSAGTWVWRAGSALLALLLGGALAPPAHANCTSHGSLRSLVSPFNPPAEQPAPEAPPPEPTTPPRPCTGPHCSQAPLTPAPAPVAPTGGAGTDPACLVPPPRETVSLLGGRLGDAGTGPRIHRAPGVYHPPR